MLLCRRIFLPALLVVLCLATHAATALAQEPTPTSSAPPDAVGSLRARPSPRPYDNPNAQPGENDVRGSRPLETTEEAGPPRLDDPVLQWLPEITAASDTTGTPISLIAAVMRVESSGDPEIVSPQGAQGLMQVMPAELAIQGIATEKWRDPATNVLAGAVILAQRSGGGWEGAAAYYFGIGCDYYGTCTYDYAVAIIGWANAYAALLGDPIWYDVGRIPVPPSTPEPTETPTAVPTTPTDATPPAPNETPVPGATDTPTATPTEVPTDAPTETPVPTEVPTDEAPSETAEPQDAATPAEASAD